MSSSTSRASGLLNRNISVATGVSATTAPAIRPAPGVNHRRTAAYTRATVATPISASGTSMLQLFTPKTRAESSIGQRKAGALSTVMELAPSNEPKKNAFQLCDPACTAAA